MKIRVRSIGLAVAILAVAGVTAPAVAADYPSKNINFVIPFSPGGGFDTYARLIAPFVEKYLPHKVNVVPRNVPGAGGRKGLNQVYRDRPDGYNIVFVNLPGAMIDPLLGRKVEYDLKKITWICRVSDDAYVLSVAAKSPIKTFAQFKTYAATHTIKMPSTGRGSTAHVMTEVFYAATGINGQVVTGYKGTKEETIGLIRGDTPAAMLPALSTRKYIQSGDVRGLLITEDPSEYPSVPSAKSLGVDDLDGMMIHRLVAAPPGLPHAIKKTLETAFLKAMADPKLLALAKKAHRPLAPLTSAQAEAAVNKQAAVYLHYKAALMK